MAATVYDDMAAEYAERSQRSVYNAYYERPATLALAGDVARLRVLDAGCGAGAHARAMVEAGAAVTGLDASTGMLAVARERLGADVPLVHADLAEPLPLPREGFDLVVAPLVLHYLRHWEPTLAEFHRVLGSGGRLVFSTHHPAMDHALAGGADYFATYRFTEEWNLGGGTVSMEFWHRPLGAMTAAVMNSGFVIETVHEPMPLPECRERDPEAFHKLSTEPRFLFFAATAAERPRY